ncbi:nuclease-related domain-containing protein [Niallia sp. 03133]|uniref:nuclease-related domain-containing protein n=1 Tax=Niallia sp. 03133 TaxID=3458060 RepID=UPI00404409A0
MLLTKLLKVFSKRTNNEKQIIIKKESNQKKSSPTPSRIGELGEYKINIQLDQLPKNFRYLSDLVIANTHAKSGYSQIDHVVLTPYAIFVIETKNFNGTVYGDRQRPQWNLNGKFPMMNPYNQNYGHIQAIKSILKSNNLTRFISIVSFTRRCTFKVNEELRKIQSNDLIVYDTELSDYIKRKCNVLRIENPRPIYSDDKIQFLFDQLKKANVTSQEVRVKHVEQLQKKYNETTSKTTCASCGKTVSEKVTTFCLSNKKRFKGNIYCFDHQKLHL